MQNFFKAQFFTPFVCKLLTKFIKSQGDISFKMYTDGNNIEYEVTGFRIFLPSSILNDGYRFNRIVGQKKLIMHLALSEENLKELIKALGGSVKKVTSQSSPPTLGDLMKNI